MKEKKVSKETQETRSKITALVFVSASELAKAIPDFSYDMIKDNKTLNNILFSLGCDVTKVIEYQETILHRNRFDEIVICDRWVANERTDPDWISSGYASQEAIDKSKNNALLNDLYRMKGLYGRD